MYIFATQNFRECAPLRKKNHELCRPSGRFLIITMRSMEAVSFKGTAGVPLEIVSTRGAAAVKVTCETLRWQIPLLWLYRRQRARLARKVRSYIGQAWVGSVHSGGEGSTGFARHTFLLRLSSASLLGGTDTCEYFAMPGLYTHRGYTSDSAPYEK